MPCLCVDLTNFKASQQVVYCCSQGVPGIDGIDGINGTDGIPGEPGPVGLPVGTCCVQSYWHAMFS